MQRQRSVIASVLAAFCALQACGYAQGTTEPFPTQSELVNRIVARAKFEKEQNHDERYFATRHIVADTLNSKGEVTEHSDSLVMPFLLDGHVFYRVMEKDGRPLTEEDKKKQIEREEKLREAFKNPPKPHKKSDDDFEINEELLNRFQMTITGIEDVEGRSAYAVAFLPKTGIKLPEKKMVDKLLNRLAGRLWIDVKTSAFIKAD